MPVSCDPQSLIDRYSCLQCVPDGMMGAVALDLMCKWASGSGGSSACTLTLTGAGTPGVNQVYTKVSDTEYDGVGFKLLQDPANFWLIVGGVAQFIYYLGPIGGAVTGPYVASGLGVNPGPTGVLICPPVATPATNIANVTLDANWDAAVGAAGYLLYVSTDPAFGSFVPGFNGLDVGNVLTYTVTGLTGGVTYYYKLQSYFGPVTSNPSNIIAADTQPGWVIADGVGGFWLLVTDDFGDVGTESVSGPASPDVVLDDGSGGFWKVIVDGAGNRGTTSVAGPATAPVPTLTDGLGNVWTLVVDTSGNLGETI